MKNTFIRQAIALAAATAMGCGVATAQNMPAEQDATPPATQGAMPDTGTSHAAASDDQPGTDGWITTQVKAELAATQDVSNADISVRTDDGVVTLAGTVASDLTADKAEAAAKSIDGVKKVDVSELKVDPDAITAAGSASDDHSSSMGEAVTDAWITTKVKTELATTKGVTSTDIAVTTVDGVVTLTGVLPDAAQVSKAEAVTRDIKGVKNVDASGLKAKE